MRNQNVEWDDSYDYAPNELSELRVSNPSLYREVVESNLSSGDTIEKWQQRNLDWAKECLDHQRRNRK